MGHDEEIKELIERVSEKVSEKIVESLIKQNLIEVESDRENDISVDLKTYRTNQHLVDDDETETDTDEYKTAPLYQSTIYEDAMTNGWSSREFPAR